MSEDRYEYKQQSLFKKHLLHLYLSQTDCDVLLTLPNSPRTFGAHTSVLAVRCRTLAASVRSFLSAKSNANSTAPSCPSKFCVRLPNVSDSTVERTLHYIYTGTFHFFAVEDSETCQFLQDVLTLAKFFGLPSLRSLLFRFVDERLSFPVLMTLLDIAICSDVLPSEDVTRLTESFCDKSAQFHDDDDNVGESNETYGSLSDTFWMYILRTEPLQMSEDQLWLLLVRRACAQLGIMYGPVSQMSETEQAFLTEIMSTYCKPGLLRILSFSTPFFIREIEPLRVFPPSEVLLKYRFDATVGTQPFFHAYPHDRLSFLMRVRQSALTIESKAHPHEKGVREDRQICMASWASQIAIKIDKRTALGKYTQLELFADDAKTERILSLRGAGSPIVSLRKQTSTSPPCDTVPHGDGPTFRKVDIVHSDVSSPIVLDTNKFFLSFYSPLNVGDTAWGYKLTVTNLR